MSQDSIKKAVVETSAMTWIERVPLLSLYARTRGLYFLISWGHRIAGGVVLIIAWIYLLQITSTYALTQGPTGSVLGSVLKWLVAIPLVFHTFNGGRVILYELFEKRNDESMTNRAFAFSGLYLLTLAVIMLVGNQGVTPFSYWLVATIAAVFVGYEIAMKISRIGHSFFWKWQRISGGFLLVMLPAYLLFISLNPTPIKGGIISGGIQKFVVAISYLGLLVATLYHGAYGIWSVLSDYLTSASMRKGLAVLLTLVSALFAWIGAKAILGIS